MNIEKLKKYSSIELEIKEIQERITELENSPLFGIEMSGMPHSTTKSNPTERVALKLISLRNLLLEKTNKLLDAGAEIENFVESITDNDIRTIIRMKYFKKYSWRKIGIELHCDRTTAYYKLMKYLEESK